MSPPPFWTRSADLNRSGCWPYESKLTSSYVQQRGIRVLGRWALDDPRGLTVTGVDFSGDLSHATVRFSSLAGKDASKDVGKALSRTAGFLRSELSRPRSSWSLFHSSS